MTPKLSSIVIINLIANLSFLYHKSDKHAVTCLTDPDHLVGGGVGGVGGGWGVVG